MFCYLLHNIWLIYFMIDVIVAAFSNVAAVWALRYLIDCLLFGLPFSKCIYGSSSPRKAMLFCYLFE